MATPATETPIRKSKRRSKRACHVCREVIPTGVRAVKFSSSTAKYDRLERGEMHLFWLCPRHGELFMAVMNWDEVPA